MSSSLFQIIFNPTSAAELAGMPKDLQLQILGEFRGPPDEVRASGYYGKLQSGVKSCTVIGWAITACILSVMIWVWWCTGFSPETR